MNEEKYFTIFKVNNLYGKSIHTKRNKIFKHFTRYLKNSENEFDIKKINFNNINHKKSYNNYFWTNNKWEKFSNLGTSKEIFEILNDNYYNNLNFLKSEFELKKKNNKSKNEKFESYLNKLTQNTFSYFVFTFTPKWFEYKNILKYDKVEPFWDAKYQKYEEDWGINLDTLNEEKLLEVFTKILNFAFYIKEIQNIGIKGKDNLIGATIHLDEKSPHMELLMTNISKKTDVRKNRMVYKLESPFKNKHYCSNGIDLFDYQTLYAEFVQKEIDKEIKRGIMNNDVKVWSQQEWKDSLVLEKFSQLDNLNQKLKEVDFKNEQIQNKEFKLEKKEIILKQKEINLNNKENNFKKISYLINKLHLSVLEENQNQLEKTYNQLKEILDEKEVKQIYNQTQKIISELNK